MSFLAPLFLLGAAAIALPVLFHLIRRSSRERVPFSSLMFLLPSPPRVTRRSRLENLLLLLLRCLVILLLAFAFARPFLSRPVAPDPAGNAGQKVLLLVDTSASMRRTDLWAQAKTRARAVLDSVSPGDQAACVTFDRELRTLVSFDQWSTLPIGERAAFVAKRLDDTAPGWSATHLGNALIAACEMFESQVDDEAPRRIVLISDLQQGSRLDGLQGFEWPRGVEVRVESVQAKRTSNAGLQLASEADGLASSGGKPGVRVRVSNSSDSKREQFQIGWQGAGQKSFVGPTIDTYVPPGQSRIVVIPQPGDASVSSRIALAGDDDDFDNSVYVLPPRTARARILALTGDRETDPARSLFYLQHAFQKTRGLAIEVLARNPAVALTDNELADTRFMVVTDDLPEDQVAAVKSFLQSDKAVLLVLTSVSMAPTLGRLVGEERMPADEISGESYAMLAQVDFEHPLFAHFADPRYSDFTKIHFWKHRQVGLDGIPGARALARFDNGNAALAEVPVGQGKLWVLTSSWQPQDSELALSSKFVPLLYAMLEQSGAIPDPRIQYWVGDSIQLATAGSVTVRGPSGSEVAVEHGEKFAQTGEPGVYTIDAAQTPLSFAVNLAPEESRTAPLPLEELERLGLPLQQQSRSSPQQVQQRKEHLQAAQLESRQKLWRWLIVTALVVLVMETWLAGRLTRRAVGAAPESTVTP